MIEVLHALERRGPMCFFNKQGSHHKQSSMTDESAQWLSSLIPRIVRPLSEHHASSSHSYAMSLLFKIYIS